MGNEKGDYDSTSNGVVCATSEPEEVAGKVKVSLDELGDAYRCGYFSWKPECLQTFNSPRWLLACVSWFTFTQGFVVNGIIYVNLAAWERLYELPSTQTAWIVSCYDVSAAIFTLLFGYFGQFMHNGVILAASAFFMACGSFTMLIPHLLSDLYELGPVPVEYCQLDNSTVDDCLTGDSSNFYWFLIAGQALHGVGGAALYTLGVPYMDDQVKIKNTPVYIGIMLCFAALGPALGYIFGGLFLNIYVDVNRMEEEIDLVPSDPRWVGAWWIGLIYSGFAALTVSALTACFPKQLPSGVKYKHERKSQAYKGAGEDELARDDFGKSGKDLLITLKFLFTNPVFIFLTISATIESGAITGFAAFLPKMIIFQFNKTPAQAAVAAGLVVVPGAAGGQLLGGLIPKWLNLDIKGLMMQCVISGLIGLGLSFQFLLRCKTPKIAGVTVPYDNMTIDPSYDMFEEPDVYHPCNLACNCTTISYDPVCGSDGVEYFTPCFAGCTSYTETESGSRIYNNCSCISETNTTIPSAEKGICAEDCDIFAVFLLFFLCINLCTFISSTAGQAAILRAVPDKQRAFAFGIRNVILRLLGNVPGPIVFGLVFDTACLVWQDVCGEQGSCWIYDSQFVAQGIAWACVVVKGISSLSFLCAYCLYKPPPVEEDKIKIGKDTINKDNVIDKGVDNDGFSVKNNDLSTYL